MRWNLGLRVELEQGLCRRCKILGGFFFVFLFFVLKQPEEEHRLPYYATILLGLTWLPVAALLYRHG